jgi:hypothetical protein
MSLDLNTGLFVVVFVYFALYFIPWSPPLPLALAALVLAVLGFIRFGWAWQLLLLLLISAIFFMFWWAQRKHSR